MRRFCPAWEEQRVSIIRSPQQFSVPEVNANRQGSSTRANRQGWHRGGFKNSCIPVRNCCEHRCCLMRQLWAVHALVIVWRTSRYLGGAVETDFGMKSHRCCFDQLKITTPEALLDIKLLLFQKDADGKLATWQFNLFRVNIRDG